uniref:Uncharacterized protein n=1 Tax=Macrostomum lignano TaxID=282301 RepID=A0A1I8HB68_9PLAT
MPLSTRKSSRSGRLTAYWLAVCIVHQLVLFKPVLAIRCFKTSIGSTAHDVDCGPLARACRTIVKPYKTQNNSAVTNCIDNQFFGRYIFDCAVECPLRKQDQYWNEMECCTSNMCNTAATLMSRRFCYISKGENSTANDDIKPCNQPKRCGVNLKTDETREEAQCNEADWKCCSGEACLSKWGVEKVSSRLVEDESSGVGRLLVSLWIVAMASVAQYPLFCCTAVLLG